MNKNYLIIFTSMALIGCSTSLNRLHQNVVVTPVSQIKWEKLNPARGEKSPQAGTLWGDRDSAIETAFLAKFVDGFSSPPHIHNVSYRAIVIGGLIHNNTPEAKPMWMPTASYWTQPAGAPHITSAKGKNSIAYVEIDKGPYLVKPTIKKIKTNEYPYNIHSSNISWAKEKGFLRASLWKNDSGKVTGTLLKFSKDIRVKSPFARIVLISGRLKFDKGLEPGSLVVIKQSQFQLSCSSDCIIYVKSDKDLKVTSSK